MEEWDKIGHPKKRAMLKALSQLGFVSAAAKAAGLQRRQTHYVWLQSDPEYAKAVKEAQDIAVEQLEAEADRRARDGVEELVLYQGKPVEVDGKPLTRKKYSDILLMFRLKALRPDKYADRRHVQQQTTINNEEWKPVWELTGEEREKRMKDYMERYQRAKKLGLS